MSKLLRKKAILEEKKKKFSSQYRIWVNNSFQIALGYLGIGVLLEIIFEKSKRVQLLYIVSCFILILYMLLGAFIVFKIITSLKLPSKINKCSRKIALIDKKIVEELNKT